MTELNSLVAGDEQASSLVVRHPGTDEPLPGANGEPWTIRLASVYSKRYTTAKHKVVNRRLQNQKKKVKSQDIDNGTVEIMAAITLGWDNPPTMNGELLEYTPEAALKLYADYAWVRKQAVDFVEDDTNFFES